MVEEIKCVRCGCDAKNHRDMYGHQEMECTLCDCKELIFPEDPNEPEWLKKLKLKHN